MQHCCQPGRLWKTSEIEKGAEERKDIKIYLQGPDYLDIDERVAHESGMKVLKWDAEGCSGIDETTFLFDLGTTFPIHQLVFEISRPALFFSHVAITEDSISPNLAHPATLKTMERQSKSQGQAGTFKLIGLKLKNG